MVILLIVVDVCQGRLIVLQVAVSFSFTVGITISSSNTIEVDIFSLGALTQGITVAIPVVVSLLALNTELVSIVISS
jgi:hypothetical protein